MEIEVQLTREPIAAIIPPPASGLAGAWVEFRGLVRSEENNTEISALEYEAYAGMAEREMRRLIAAVSEQQPCLAVKVVHRIGVVPVGETAVYVGVAAKHRGAAFAVLAGFMDQLKQDVPIWKRRALAGLVAVAALRPLPPPAKRLAAGPARNAPLPLETALAHIHARIPPLPAVSLPLQDAAGHVLRENLVATDDSPAADRSTRDGYAILQTDSSATFCITDTLHAADCKPRQLGPGEAVRVATGTTLPCAGLRVIMQENAERTGNQIKILRSETATNVCRHGEDWQAGDTLLPAGKVLDAGALAVLASVGCTQPRVSPQLPVLHFTTGDELVPPTTSPQPGQIRDCNSILIRALLEKQGCAVTQQHLPENFEAAQRVVASLVPPAPTFNLVLISGGAGGGDKDFTRALLEWLGFEIVFDRVNIRPGAPLIFGVNGTRIAFGLPGNPLSHFVCFHLFVAAALKRLTGAEPDGMCSGMLAGKIEDAPNARETLWPARVILENRHARLTPLRWHSSGDVTCLAAANALIRVPAESGLLPAGTEVNFLPV
jgi:molybdopterin molybdotransferase